MKKNIHLNYIFLIISFIPNYLMGQFTAPSTGENAAGVATILPRSTGNDIWNSGSDIFRVSVYDDGKNSPKLAWRVLIGSINYNSNTNLGITAAVQDPDVALISDGTDMFAIVVYHCNNGTARYVIETFKWHNPGSGLGFHSMGTPVGLWSSAFNSAINVDATSNKDFAVVWDTPTPTVRIMTGNVASGVFTFNNNGTSVVVSNGESPDVSMFYASGAGNNRVYITYLTNSYTRLFVEYESFATIAGGTYGPASQPINNVGTSQASGGTYGHPRIACPNSNGAVSDWTVVVEETDGTSQWIIGYNDNAASTPIIYSRANSNDISSEPNYFPVVTYDNDSPINVWVGWILDNSSGNITGTPADAIFPIGLLCDINGTIVSTNYLEIANGIASTNDEATILSLSGRYATCNVYASYIGVTYSSSSIDDLYTKSIACTATTFKLNPLSSVFDEKSIYLFSVYDLTGRLLSRVEGEYTELLKILNTIDELYSVNIVSAINLNSGESIVKKFAIKD